MDEEEAFISLQGNYWAAALQSALALLVDTTTHISGARRDDIQRDKRRAVEDFFAFAGKRPADVGPPDVQAWQSHLEQRGLASNTIYTRVSFLSSFYIWAMKNNPAGETIIRNPVLLARPKRPKPYQSESTKSLDDDQVRALVRVVKAKADRGDIIAKRDLALLLRFLMTGMRRPEVITMRGKDIDLKEDRIIVRGRVKGGTYVGREIKSPDLRAAVMDYLTASRRMRTLKGDAPLRTCHNRVGKPGEQLSSHSFVRNLKLYAEAAALNHIHLHEARHTYARIVSEEMGSLIETQHASGHESLKTTRIYV
jgi:site-specific recombinase XerD